jgi:hypothetical protein
LKFSGESSETFGHGRTTIFGNDIAEEGMLERSEGFSESRTAGQQVAARLSRVVTVGTEGVGLGLEIEALFVSIPAKNHFRLRSSADVESGFLYGASRRIREGERLLDVNEAESVFVEDRPNAVAIRRLLLRHPEEEIQLKYRVSNENLILHL